MENLNVPYINDFREGNINEVSCRMNTLERHNIGEMPWQEFPLKPKVSFGIAYTDNFILLKYFIQEKTIRVVYNQDNSPVHLDSCVEFFVSFNDDASYYNLEFNSIGVCCFGYGKDKSDRVLIQLEEISKIRRRSAIESSIENGNPCIHWELTVMIPFEVFVFHKITSLADVNCRGNFYKCGDDLPIPHFLAWQKLISDQPNFHLPEFFGHLHFTNPA